MNNTNIFVVHSIFQDLIAHHMVESIPDLKKSENYLFYNMILNRNERQSTFWKKVINLEPVGGTVLGDKRKYICALNKVLHLIEEKKTCRVFLSDLNWPLNNGIYGNIIRKKLSQVELCNFPDGIGNLYVVDINSKQKLKNMLKSSLGTCGITIPYYNYKSDHMGLGLFDKIYSLMPPLINKSIRNEVIEIPKIIPNLIEIEKDTLVFLGQPYELHVPNKKYQELILETIKFTKKLGYASLFYKPHPRENLNKAWNVFEENGFVLLNEKRSIEELYLTKQLECVVSYNSSALINLKLMFGDKIRCISFSGTGLFRFTGLKEEVVDKIKYIYKTTGVESYTGKVIN